MFINDSIITNDSSTPTPTSCVVWQHTHEPMIHVGNAFITLGLLAWNRISGMLFLHLTFVIGFLLKSVWAWVHICAVDVFSWNFVFAMLNIGQLAFILYTLRPTKFSPELEDIYESIFKPLRVPRSMFKKLTQPDMCRVNGLDAGEKYAMRRVTHTDKLGLLISGTVNVYNNSTLLHQVDERQFLDSPEFESNVSGDDMYQVTIVAVESVRYIHWCKQALDALLLKEPYLGVIMGVLIGRDITNKLYALNEKAHPSSLSTRRPDIRLPSLASSHRSGTYSGGTQSPVNLSCNVSCGSVSCPGTERPQERLSGEADYPREHGNLQRRSVSQNWEITSRNSAGESISGVAPVSR